MLCGWEGNRRSDIASVIRHIPCAARHVHLRLNGGRKGDERSRNNGRPVGLGFGIKTASYSINLQEAATMRGAYDGRGVSPLDLQRHVICCSGW